MRTTTLMLALVALPFAAPSFAASPSARDVQACNEIADAHGVTGRARTAFVQKCFEGSSSDRNRTITRGHRQS